MGTVCKTLHLLRPGCGRALGLAGVGLAVALWCPGGMARLRAADNPVKNASDFSSVDYYDPPNQMQIKSRLAGAEAIPQPDGRVLVRQLKLETFATNGQPEFVVEAPECLYDQIKGTASSAGVLKVRQADGQVRIAGTGFAWEQEAEFLTVSNQDVTEIRAGQKLKFVP